MKLFKKRRNYIDEMLEISYENLNTATTPEEKATYMTDIYRLEELKTRKKQGGITKADLFQAGISIFTILLVLKYEEANVITTKVWNKIKW